MLGESYMPKYVGIYIKFTGAPKSILKLKTNLENICEFFKCNLLYVDTAERLDFDNFESIENHFHDNSIILYNDTADWEAYQELIIPSKSDVSTTWKTALCGLVDTESSTSFLIEFDDWYNDEGYYETTKCTCKNNKIQIYRQKFHHDINTVSDDEFLNIAKYFGRVVSYEHYIELLNKTEHYEGRPNPESITPKNYLIPLIEEIVTKMTQGSQSINDINSLLQEEGISWSSYLESDERKSYDKETGRGLICDLTVPMTT